MDPKTKYFFAQVKAVNEEARTIDAVASTRDLDRDGDIILPSAFTETLGAFKANPVILATHQHRLFTGSSPVIGSAIPESIKITDNEVLFTMTFAGTALGEEYWQLYRDKHMRAFSIGFMSIEWADEKDEDRGYVRTYTKIELLEISAVPVPSNRAALARAKGFFENEDIKDAIAETVKAILDERCHDTEKLFADLHSFCEEGFDEIKSLLIADSDGFAERLLGGDSEPSARSGDKTAERIVSTCKQLTEK